ncbi:MAG TPA: AcvB/VirJ family lysyl-phosphatidylglycerol hydrolase [Flavisolibacter sp.]|nr:AcvB/VirJ family lysyl-phosphatidylglycerol hydrolase [Flavisolibacter sp.]
MKKLILSIIILASLHANSQSLPIKFLKSNDVTKPLIFYISGDGGWNNFSTSFIQLLNKQGYSVVGLDAKSYFWDKKKPEQAAADVTNLLNQYMKECNTRSVLLIGYSFGADVMPFIQTRLPKYISDSIRRTVLMSPSKKTDFEIHVLGMLGFGGNDGMSVPDEINKIGPPVTFLFGSDEHDFPLNKLTVKNPAIITLPGGHHYDGNVNEIVSRIENSLR